MLITMQIFNDTTDGKVFQAQSASIDGAIAELGRLERIIDNNKCLHCSEPIPNDQGFCNDTCAERWQEEEITAEDLPF